MASSSFVLVLMYHSVSMATLLQTYALRAALVLMFRHRLSMLMQTATQLFSHLLQFLLTTSRSLQQVQTQTVRSTSAVMQISTVSSASLLVTTALSARQVSRRHGTSSIRATEHLLLLISDFDFRISAPGRNPGSFSFWRLGAPSTEVESAPLCY